MSLTFDNLKTDAGLKQLNTYLVGRTFVFGIEPSNADLTLMGLVGDKCPDASKYANVARWFNYISGFEAAEQKKFGKTSLTVSTGSAAAKTAGATKDDEDDEDSDDLFGSDDEDVDLEALAKADMAARAKKKKRAPLCRSQIIFDIKPSDVDVDLEEMADNIKEIEVGKMEKYVQKMKDFDDERVTVENICDWGEGHEVVPIAFGICKLQVSCCVLDDLMGTEDIEEILTEKFGDSIQSIDVAAFNKANALK